MGDPNFSIKGSISEPALFCAGKLVEHLQNCEVNVSGGASSIRLEHLAGISVMGKRNRIFVHQSATLREMIIPLNFKSINLYAESLLKAVAVKSGKEGSTEMGAEVMTKYWKDQGIDTKSMFIRDGSGLSANNAMSTLQMVSMLSKASKAAYYPDLYASIPVAGRSGAMENMLKGTVAEGRLRAKSGFIAGARGYVGYATTVSGKEVVFAMTAHNYGSSPTRMRQEFEKLMVAIVQGK
jgi:D-alanyl-D-alanine carboxypeptidase/D-alanyl-D-alanine-endopeptidase (penicillin-binding protein 4)